MRTQAKSATLKRMEFQEVFKTEKGNKLIDTYGLTMVLLFGSRVTGKTHSHSDTDLAYLANRQLTLSEEGAMLTELMPLMKSKFIDLVDIRHAPPLLKKQIARNHIVLHQTAEKSGSDFIAQAFREYEETRSLREALHEYLTKRIKGFEQELQHVR